MKSKRHSIESLAAVILSARWVEHTLKRITGGLISAFGAGLSASPTA